MPLESLYTDEKGEEYAITVRHFQDRGSFHRVTHDAEDGNDPSEAFMRQQVEEMVAAIQSVSPVESPRIETLRTLYQDRENWGLEDRQSWEEALSLEVNARTAGRYGDYSTGALNRSDRISAAIAEGEWECEMQSSVEGMIMQRIEDAVLEQGDGYGNAGEYVLVGGHTYGRLTGKAYEEATYHQYVLTPLGNMHESITDYSYLETTLDREDRARAVEEVLHSKANFNAFAVYDGNISFNSMRTYTISNESFPARNLLKEGLDMESPDFEKLPEAERIREAIESNGVLPNTHPFNNAHVLLQIHERIDQVPDMLANAQLFRDAGITPAQYFEYIAKDGVTEEEIEQINILVDNTGLRQALDLHYQGLELDVVTRHTEGHVAFDMKVSVEGVIDEVVDLGSYLAEPVSPLSAASPEQQGHSEGRQ